MYCFYAYVNRKKGFIPEASLWVFALIVFITADDRFIYIE